MPKLALGQFVATPAALVALDFAHLDPLELVARHLNGDWGDVSDDDWKTNDEALTLGERVISAYKLPTNTKVWLITEADRSVTTLLLPSEY